MRTYKEFIYIVEELTGGTVGFRVPIGGTRNQLPGFKGVTGSVQGSSGGTQYGASGSFGSGTVSGQGDKINRGISASIDNSTSGGSDKDWKGVPYRTPNADTSTSTIRQGTMGTFNANVSGGKSGSTPTPAPKPEKPVKPVKPTTLTTPTKPSPRPIVSPAVQQQMTRALPVGQQPNGPKAPAPKIGRAHV